MNTEAMPATPPFGGLRHDDRPPHRRLFGRGR
jgi:hypothetical protein